MKKVIIVRDDLLLTEEECSASSKLMCLPRAYLFEGSPSVYGDNLLISKVIDINTDSTKTAHIFADLEHAKYLRSCLDAYIAQEERLYRESGEFECTATMCKTPVGDDKKFLFLITNTHADGIIYNSSKDGKVFDSVEEAREAGMAYAKDLQDAAGCRSI